MQETLVVNALLKHAKVQDVLALLAEQLVELVARQRLLVKGIKGLAHLPDLRLGVEDAAQKPGMQCLEGFVDGEVIQEMAIAAEFVGGFSCHREAREIGTGT